MSISFSFRKLISCTWCLQLEDQTDLIVKTLKPYHWKACKEEKKRALMVDQTCPTLGLVQSVFEARKTWGPHAYFCTKRLHQKICLFFFLNKDPENLKRFAYKLGRAWTQPLSIHFAHKGVWMEGSLPTSGLLVKHSEFLRISICPN